MSHFTAVYYELPEAIKKAAEQNYLRDYRHGLEQYENWTDADELTHELYLEEAEHLLTTSGQNYDPESPDTELICLAGFQGVLK